MFKKNYFYLTIAIIATLHSGYDLIINPESVALWFIRGLGGYFILLATGFVLDIQKIYLQSKINKLNKQISEKSTTIFNNLN